jgi:hypothetical protein
MFESRCPECDLVVDPNTTYKCPECEHKFWNSYKDFQKNKSKSHVSKVKEITSESEPLPIVKSKANVDWAAIGTYIFWGLVICGGIFWFYVDSKSNSSTSSSSNASTYYDDCQECKDGLEKANDRISELEECNDQMSSALDSIHSDASLNAWEDYNTMGDTLDDIDYKSGSFNFCN